jgi:hypothetical protein
LPGLGNTFLSGRLLLQGEREREREREMEMMMMMMRF